MIEQKDLDLNQASLTKAKLSAQPLRVECRPSATGSSRTSGRLPIRPVARFLTAPLKTQASRRARVTGSLGAFATWLASMKLCVPMLIVCARPVSERAEKTRTGSGRRRSKPPRAPGCDRRVTDDARRRPQPGKAGARRRHRNRSSWSRSRRSWPGSRQKFVSFSRR